MKTILVSVLVFSLVFAGQAFALEESTYLIMENAATGEGITEGSPFTACPRPVTAMDISLRLTNLEDDSRIFTLSLGLPEGWGGEIQENMSLSSGETGGIGLIIVNIPSDAKAGVYPVEVLAESYGKTDSHNLYIRVLSCHSVSIEAGEDFLAVCSEFEEYVTFSFEVANKGKETDTVWLSAAWNGRPVDFGNFSRAELEIPAGGRAGTELSVEAGWFTGTGKERIYVTARSGSGKSATIPVDFIVEDCFDYGIKLDPATRDEVCLGLSAEYILEIENLGNTDTFRITSSDWVVPASDYVSVGRGGKAEVTLVLTPGKLGPRGFNVTAWSSRTDSYRRVEGSIEAKDCGDVDIAIFPETQKVCRGKRAEFEVTVTNLGTLGGTFDIVSDLGGKSSSVTLEPGESIFTGLTVDTRDMEGLKEGKVIANSNGTFDEAAFSLEVEECPEIGLKISPEEVSVCPCAEIPYTVTLGNLGEKTDTYKLTFGGKERQVHLLAGKNTSFTFRSAIGCDMEGRYRIDVSAESKSEAAETSSGITVLAPGECWSVELLEGRKLTARLGDEEMTVPVEVKNTGKEPGVFRISAEGPEWISVSPTLLTIGAGETQVSCLHISPEGAGEYNVTIIALSDRAESSAVLKVVTGSSDVGLFEEVAEASTGPDGMTGYISGAVPAWKTLTVGVITLIVIMILIVRFAIFVKPLEEA